MWIWNLESGMRGLYGVLRVWSFGCRSTLSSFLLILFHTCRAGFFGGVLENRMELDFWGGSLSLGGLFIYISFFTVGLD